MVVDRGGDAPALLRGRAASQVEPGCPQPGIRRGDTPALSQERLRRGARLDYNHVVMDVPLAYHITFGTYGSRLHGDERGSVDRAHNSPGEPFLGPDVRRREQETQLLRSEPITFKSAQQRFIEAVIPGVCERGDWGYHVAAAGPDHVHVLLSADSDPKTVRRLLKRWLGQQLSSNWPLSRGQSWWAEGGSIKWIWKQHYFRRAFDYIASQRATK